MSRKLHNETQRHQDKGYGNNRIGQWRNWQETRKNKSRRSAGLHSIFHIPIQQEEIQEITGKM